MLDGRINRRINSKHVAMAFVIAALPLVYLDAPAALAQNMMRMPNVNVDTRIPTINPTVAPRVDPNIAGRANVINSVDRGPPSVNTTTSMRIHRNPNSTMPHARFSPNLYPACESAYRDSDGECSSKPASSGDGGSGKSAKKGKGNNPSSNSSQAGAKLLSFSNQLVAEIDGALTDAQTDELARRHGLVRVESQNFPLIRATIGLFRITGNRPAAVVSREFATEAGIRDVQFNLRYYVQDQKTPTEGDPAQYAVAKLRLPQAHTLAHGMNVTVAVIDSGIDISHPELSAPLDEEAKARIARMRASGALPISRACAAIAPAIPVPWTCGPSLLPSASKLSAMVLASSGWLMSMPESITATVTFMPCASVCACGRRSFATAYCAGSPSVGVFWSCT